MRDKVEVRIGSKAITRFLEYEADSDLLVPADAFSCRLGRLTEAEAAVIRTGAEFGLFVNGVQEMRGIIDSAEKTHSRGELSLSLEGRDLGGILVDACVTKWETLNKMGLKQLAQDLLSHLPFISKERIACGKGVGAAAQAAFKKSQYEPGVTVVQALSDYCQRQGLIFWVEPDGTVMFDKLAISGSPEFYFYCHSAADKKMMNNVISVTESDNISKRYSQVTVVGQVQGDDTFDVGGHSVRATAKDKSFPFYKPLVVAAAAHEGSVKSQAEHELKKRVAEGYRITVTVSGHSQGGRNYRANRLAYLADDRLGIEGQYLVLARKFTMDKGSGPRTTLTLGLPMEGYSVS